MVPLGRLERPTRGLGNRCSIHLSYRGTLNHFESSGDRGIRTPNLCDANAALSQLSYIPVNLILARMQNLSQSDLLLASSHLSLLY